MPQTILDCITRLGTKTHVDPSLGNRPTIRVESVLLAARTQQSEEPFSLTQFIPIGLVQGASIQQKKNIAQLYELGSHQSYMIPGRTSIMASLNRVFLDGNSLMRVLYGDEEMDLEDSGFSSLGGDIIINLASELLNNSCDLLFLFFDIDNIPLGGFYLEDSFIFQHQLTFSAENVIIAESIMLICNKIVSVGL